MTEINPAPTVTEALAKWLRDYAKPTIVTITPPEQPPGAEKLYPVEIGVSEDGKIVNFASIFDAQRMHPRRRTGTAEMRDLPSFIAHVQRFQDSDSALFCDPTARPPVLQAVLDYHQRVNQAVPGSDGTIVQETIVVGGGVPRFGSHRSLYSFPISDEWKAWHAKNGEKMRQGEFAEFLEDRALDVIEYTATADPSATDERVARMIGILGGTMASPGRLMELSRGLQVHQQEKVATATNLSSGEGQIVYEAAHTDPNGGGPIKVPNMFMIAIPIFEAGPAWRIPVRLRYRINQGTLLWFYEMSYVVETFDAAVRDAAATAAAETNLPLFFGKPELVVGS